MAFSPSLSFFRYCLTAAATFASALAMSRVASALSLQAFCMITGQCVALLDRNLVGGVRLGDRELLGILRREHVQFALFLGCLVLRFRDVCFSSCFAAATSLSTLLGDSALLQAARANIAMAVAKISWIFMPLIPRIALIVVFRWSRCRESVERVRA